MKIAVVDDLIKDRKELISHLFDYFEKYNINAQIDEFESGEQFLQVFEKDMYDLCFMDIFMSGLNGMQTSRSLYARDSDCMIIFLTTSTEFIADGYDVRAWRYLIKPITEDILTKILPDCIDIILQRQCRLRVLVNRIETEIPFSKISYVLSTNRKTEIHMEKEVVELSSHIPFSKTIEPLLLDYRFIQCGKGIVVNMSHIVNITSSGFMMNNGTTLPISRRELQSAKKNYLSFSFDSL